ncbi:hepatitis A virus cellular receptor 1 homolog [Cavia porcellus]|uniref:hepatitis A virus cellular receptor 1 homolog n=1 Tax=Cavia porcellus TaxID=10141 RepID=UPI0003511BAF|nr:hepatitis A virus cellular receptor 1 homolog [Cavia porcellus]
MILQPQVVALGLLLLQTGAVFPNQVDTMEGETVTLPCSYSVRNKTVLPMCWDRGPCSSSRCSGTLIKTDGHRVTYRKDSHSWLHGKISQGDVSLTIQNVTVGDLGLYCCHTEFLRWFSRTKKTAHLSVMPAGTASVPTSARVSTSPPTPEQTQSKETESTPLVPTQAVGRQHTTLQETKPQPVTSTMDSQPSADGSGTVTQSAGGLNNRNVFFPEEAYMGVLAITLASFVIVVVIIITNYFNSRVKMKTLSKVWETHPQYQVLQEQDLAGNKACVIKSKI